MVTRTYMDIPENPHPKPIQTNHITPSHFDGLRVRVWTDAAGIEHVTDIPWSAPSEFDEQDNNAADPREQDRK
jgi:hypothetical protein